MTKYNIIVIVCFLCLRLVGLFVNGINFLLVSVFQPALRDLIMSAKNIYLIGREKVVLSVRFVSVFCNYLNYCVCQNLIMLLYIYNAIIFIYIKKR